MTLMLFLAAATAVAQQPLGLEAYDLDHFEGLKSEGPMPVDLRNSLRELYTLDKDRMREYNDGKLRNRDKLLRTSYHINKLMASGRISYGDPICRLSERIADTLLKDYPTLRGELRFYTLKSPEVNAFSTGQGMIFICTGLVAHLDNEAELAFVISHEIIHYFRKHQLETLSRRRNYSDDIDAETRELRDFIKYHNRSREMENESDSLGLALFFLPSPYSPSVMDGVFDMLQHGSLPFGDMELDPAFFDVPGYAVASNLFLDEVDPVVFDEDYNDSLSTHPNIGSRRRKCNLLTAGSEEGCRFLMISPDDFRFLRTLARMECIRQELIYSEYALSFYESALLLSEMPDNSFAWRSLNQSLYCLSRYKTQTQSSNIVGDFKEVEGELQQSYCFFRRVDREDLALVTARQLWLNHLRFPNDRETEAMLDDILSDLMDEYGYKSSFFVEHYSGDDSQEQNDTVSYKSARERLLARKKARAATSGREYAFCDVPEFDLLLHRMEWPLTDTLPEPQLSNQLVYTPQYFIYEDISKEMNFLKSANYEASLFGHLSDMAAKAGMGSLDFSDQSLHDMVSEERYNEWVELNEWVAEYQQFQNHIVMRQTTQSQLERLARHHQAGTINMTVVLNNEHAYCSPNLYAALILLPLAPHIIFNSLSGSETTIVYSAQIQPLTGRTIQKNVYVYPLKDERSRVRSCLYDHFANIGHDSASLVPGYLGSRLSMQLDLSLGLGSRTLFEYDNSSLHHFWLSPRAELDLQYVIKRHTSASLLLGWLPFSYPVLETLDSRQVYNQNNWSASLLFRFYSHGCLAPLGPYVGLGPVLNFYRGRTVDPEMRTTAWIPGVEIQTGRTYIVGDHLSLTPFSDYRITFSSLSNDSEIENEQSKMKVLSNLVRFGFSIGLIP